MLALRHTARSGILAGQNVAQVRRVTTFSVAHMFKDELTPYKPTLENKGVFEEDAPTLEQWRAKNKDPFANMSAADRVAWIDNPKNKVNNPWQPHLPYWNYGPHCTLYGRTKRPTSFIGDLTFPIYYPIWSGATDGRTPYLLLSWGLVLAGGYFCNECHKWRFQLDARMKAYYLEGKGRP